MLANAARSTILGKRFCRILQQLFLYDGKEPDPDLPFWVHRVTGVLRLSRGSRPVRNRHNSAGATIAPKPPNRQTEPRPLALRPLRLLVMISSLEGGGSERQVILLLEHLDRRLFAPELFVLRRGGSLEARLPADVPVHDFETAVPAGRAEKIRSYLPGEFIVSRSIFLPGCCGDGRSM